MSVPSIKLLFPWSLPFLARKGSLSARLPMVFLSFTPRYRPVVTNAKNPIDSSVVDQSEFWKNV